MEHPCGERGFQMEYIWWKDKDPLNFEDGVTPWNEIPFICYSNSNSLKSLSHEHQSPFTVVNEPHVPHPSHLVPASTSHFPWPVAWQPSSNQCRTPTLSSNLHGSHEGTARDGVAYWCKPSSGTLDLGSTMSDLIGWAMSDSQQNKERVGLGVGDPGLDGSKICRMQFDDGGASATGDELLRW